MTLKRATSTLAIAAISSLTLIPLSNAANAREFGRHGGHGMRSEFHHSQHRGFNHHRRGFRHHRHHNGRNFALGAFAAVLGLAIAAEANRVNQDRYDDRYYDGY